MTAPGRDPQLPRPLRVLVNAGPTREFFDTVRFISNASSGRQGFAIAAAAVARGHQVVLVSGPVALADVPGVRMIRVTRAAELAEACKREFEGCDAAILTAAVCDYRPVEIHPHKLHKSARCRTVRLQPTEDICAALGAVKGERLLVGFAMDDHDARARAEAKLRRKNCDLIIQNGPQNIASDDVVITVLDRISGWGATRSGSKSEIAHFIVEWVEARLRERPPAAASGRTR